MAPLGHYYAVGLRYGERSTTAVLWFYEVPQSGNQSPLANPLTIRWKV